jgi:hypothetical protein
MIEFQSSATSPAKPTIVKSGVSMEMIGNLSLTKGVPGRKKTAWSYPVIKMRLPALWRVRAAGGNPRKAPFMLPHWANYDDCGQFGSRTALATKTQGTTSAGIRASFFGPLQP